MKIAIAQLNYHVGNFKYNTDKIISAIKKAKKDSAKLIVFSELSVCGYPPQDLLEHKNFIGECDKSVNRIVNECEGIAAIIGSPTINQEDTGKNLYNSGIFIKDQKVCKIINKTLLPTYDIFDEDRHFESNMEFSIINLNGYKIALTICEDLWDEQIKSTEFEKEKLYRNSPMKELSKMNPDFIVNIAASPFSYNQSKIRLNTIKKSIKQYKLPVVYANQVGANTDLIFDGESFVMNSDAKVTHLCNSFEEDIIYTDINNLKPNSNIKIRESEKYSKINKALVLGISDFFNKNGFSKATLGLSGGIDSALTLALAVQAIGGKNIKVLIMPSKYSSQHSIDDSIEMAERCNVEYEIINIENLRLEFNKSLKSLFTDLKSDTTEENIQARIRGILLMALSNKFGHILLNTSNKSEAAVGYTTLYGDMSGGLSVIGDLYKTEVYYLSNHINQNIAPIIPENILTKPPSAELKFDQKDSDSLPDYNILDQILYNYIERKMPASKIIIESGFDEKTVKKVINLVNHSEYKRFQAPPVLRVSDKSFGHGRRMPLVAKYSII